MPQAESVSTTNGWVQHNGQGRPVPAGTPVEVEMFNGVRRQITAGSGTHDIDGTPIPDWRSAGWSAWDYSDGGPMEPKFKAYRVLLLDSRKERDAALFQSWLNVPHVETATAFFADF